MKFSIQYIVVAAFCLLSSAQALADNKDMIFRRHLNRVAAQKELLQKQLSQANKQSGQQAPPESSTTLSLLYDQKLDHDNSADKTTFQQRYYVNSDFATSSDAPTIYYICGEGECTKYDLERGSIVAYAKLLKAHRVALEHRYYGKSQPFSDLSAAHLKYLTTKNAIADLAEFQAFATAKYGMNGKWIAIGGSYPGSLSAYYREVHPELVVGALASSAPVMAKENFEEYDLHVSKVVGKECGDAMRFVVKKLEDSLGNANQLAAYKAMFKAEQVKDSADFLYVVADMGAIAVQYGSDAYFCNTILSASDPVAGYAKAGVALFAQFGITPYEDSAQAAMSETINSTAFGMRQWIYQTCTEYGYFQVAYHDPKISVRSQLVSLEANRNICKNLFGVDPLDTNKINKAYYEPLLDATKVSNILFTNGSSDPWSNLGITKANNNNTNSATTEYLIDGASHCEDLGTYPSAGPVGEAQKLFVSLAQTWLK